MAPKPKVKPKGKPKSDDDALKTQEATDVNNNLPISPTNLLLGQLHILFYARALDAFTRKVSKCVYFLSLQTREFCPVEGASSRPTFPTDESFNGNCYIFTRKIESHSSLERGMVVTLYNPFYRGKETDAPILLVKRIRALAGDLVWTRKDCKATTLVRVPPDYAWLEGDSGEENSTDSTHFGPVPLWRIRSTVTHLVYPFHAAGRIRWWEYDLGHRIVQDQDLVKKYEKEGYKFKFVPIPKFQEELAKSAKWFRESGLEDARCYLYQKQRERDQARRDQARHDQARRDQAQRDHLPKISRASRAAPMRYGRFMGGRPLVNSTLIAMGGFCAWAWGTTFVSSMSDL